MRKLIAGMKISADGKMEGPEGYADWVDAWSEDYGLTAQIDACVLGSGMYPGYEQYWTAIQNAPDAALPMTGKLPTTAEVAWGRFAARTPHYVLSRSMSVANWPLTRFLRDVAELADLKQQSGKDIYLMGGGRVTASLIDAALVDELRLIVYPLFAGEGKTLFTSRQRRGLDLKSVERLPGGKLNLTYAVG